MAELNAALYRSVRESVFRAIGFAREAFTINVSLACAKHHHDDGTSLEPKLRGKSHAFPKCPFVL